MDQDLKAVCTCVMALILSLVAWGFYSTRLSHEVEIRCLKAHGEMVDRRSGTYCVFGGAR